MLGKNNFLYAFRKFIHFFDLIFAFDIYWYIDVPIALNICRKQLFFPSVLLSIGQLLNALKQLFSKLQKLEVLKLIDLVLERYQTNHLFDTIHTTWLVTLKVLHIVNITMVHCPITSIGLFINLQVLFFFSSFWYFILKLVFLFYYFLFRVCIFFLIFSQILVISPHNIDDKILEILSESKLLHLYLLQNEHTPKNITVAACSSKAWGNFHDRNASIQVHLVIDVVRNDTDLVIQPNAPVYSVTYKAPYLKVNSIICLKISYA